MTIPTPEQARAEMEAAGQPGEASEEERLPPTTTLHIDETIQGIRYKGEFHFEVPTLQQHIAIGQLKTRYMPQGVMADENAALLIEMICYLEITLGKKRPEWYQPMNMRSSDLVAAIYTEANAYANRFLGRNKDGTAAGGSDEQRNPGGNPPDDEGPLGEDVPGADERSPVTLAHSKRAD